jgi:acetyl esterase/lipase
MAIAERVVAIGHSAGGHLPTWAAGRIGDVSRVRLVDGGDLPSPSYEC